MKTTCLQALKFRRSSCHPFITDRLTFNSSSLKFLDKLHGKWIYRIGIHFQTSNAFPKTYQQRMFGAISSSLISFQSRELELNFSSQTQKMSSHQQNEMIPSASSSSSESNGKHSSSEEAEYPRVLDRNLFKKKINVLLTRVPVKNLSVLNKKLKGYVMAF